MRMHFLLPLLGLACTHRVPLEPVAATQREITILVPGYRGSFLVSETNETAWLTPAQALLGADKALALPFEGQRAFPRWGPLRPDGALTGFSVLPFVGYRAYAPLMEFGRRRLPGFEVFAYDWRRDVQESGAALCARIDALAQARGGEVVVNVVAHSMGGLVAMACLRGPGEQGWAPQSASVRRLVILATPFRGAPGIFDDLFEGTQTGRDKTLLTAEALFSFPSAFQLLPAQGDFLEDAQGRTVPFELHDAAIWLSRGWAVFQDASLRENEAYVTQLRQRLAAHAQVHRPRAVDTPPFRTLVVVGTGRATTRGFLIGAEGQVRLDAPLPADGDGTVLVTRAQPPPDLKGAELITTRAEHVEMLDDADVQAAIAAFLRR